MYVTLCYDGEGLKEIWLSIGRAGSCEKAFLQALARSIAVGLQNGVGVEEYVEQLQGITCRPVGHQEGGFVYSPADGLARALKKGGLVGNGFGK